MTKASNIAAVASIMFLPQLAMAQPTTYSGLVGVILGFVNILIPAMFGVVFVWLVWRVIDAWIINAGDPAKREEGRRMALTAVLVLVVAVSVWGIVSLIQDSFLS